MSRIHGWADELSRLDADIDGYLTSWKLPASDGWRPRITLRQLLAHTAGLSYNWFPGYGPDLPLPTACCREASGGTRAATTRCFSSC
jgi:CubicO group peptidase (beta-lactamase class C family)